MTVSTVDTDFPPEQRDLVKDYLHGKEGLYCADIITFNTIALKGAIKDVGRALEIGLDTINNISDNIESQEKQFRTEYPELFKYVDLLQGVIVSMGVHAGGVIVSPYCLDEAIGTCTLKTSTRPVSQINMNEVEGLNFVKLDVLSLDMISIIDQATKFAGLEPITPDNIDPNDEAVWNDMRKSTFSIFQWGGTSAEAYYQQLFSDETISKIKQIQGDDFNYMSLFSMGNGAIRPAGNSYRESLANGEFRDNGHEVLNDFLRPTLGFCIFQEDIMNFLHQFCGFTMGEADVVRRSFSGKSNTSQYTPRIIKGFVETMDRDYGVCKQEAEEVVVAFIKIIEDASDYLFSINHSQSYSYIGYVCGWLRYYYTLEYLVAYLNVNKGHQVKTADAFNYIYEFTDIEVVPIKFRYSKAEYNIDKEKNLIYKGIESIKHMNAKVADELYELRDNEYTHFVDLLIDIEEQTTCSARQMKILIELNFFDEFSGVQKLLDVYEEFQNGKFRYKKTHIDKTKEVRKKALIELECTLEDRDVSPVKRVQNELEHLGYAESVVEDMDADIGIVSKLEQNQWGTTFIDLYRFNTGEIDSLKITKAVYMSNPIKELDTIKTITIENKHKRRKVDGEWTELEEKEEILLKWAKVVV